MDLPAADIPGPSIERVRHETRRRTLEVARIEWVTPAMVRIGLAGDLGDFVSAAFDDHIRIFLPGADGAPVSREFTPRRFDNAAKTLDIDFAVHASGPAVEWARNARRGDQLEIGGPRGSAVVSSDVKRWLMIGDESALPAIGRRIEEATAGTRIDVIGLVAGEAERQTFESKAEVTARWLYRPLSAAADPAPVLDLLANVEIEPRTFVWIAAESAVARAVRGYLVDKRGHALSWTKAAGYWVTGQADTSDKFG